MFAILQFAEEFLVSAVVNVQYNIDRDQKKPVFTTIFIRNLEIKSPTVFCLAEVSDCSALIEVSLLFTEGHRSGLHHLSLSLIFYPRSVFSLSYIPSLTFY